MGGLVGLVGSCVFHAPKSESNSFSAQIVRTRVNQESVSMPIPVCMTYKHRPGAACFNETVGCVLWWLFLIWSPPVTSKLCSSSIQIHSQQPFLAKWRSVGCPVPRPMTKCTLSCDLWLEEYSEFLSFFGPRPVVICHPFFCLLVICNCCSASWTWWALPLELALVVVSVAWLEDGCVDSSMSMLAWFVIGFTEWYVKHLGEALPSSKLEAGMTFARSLRNFPKDGRVRRWNGWANLWACELCSCQGHRLSGAFAAVWNPGAPSVKWVKSINPRNPHASIFSWPCSGKFVIGGYLISLK